MHRRAAKYPHPGILSLRHLPSHCDEGLAHEYDIGRWARYRNEARSRRGPNGVARIGDAELGELGHHIRRQDPAEIDHFRSQFARGIDVQHGAVEVPNKTLACREPLEELLDRPAPQVATQLALDLVADLDWNVDVAAELEQGVLEVLLDDDVLVGARRPFRVQCSGDLWHSDKDCRRREDSGDDLQRHGSSPECTPGGLRREERNSVNPEMRKTVSRRNWRDQSHIWSRAQAPRRRPSSSRLLF